MKTEGSERVLKLDGRTISILRSWKAKQMTLGLHRPDDFVLANAERQADPPSAGAPDAPGRRPPAVGTEAFRQPEADVVTLKAVGS